MELAAIRVKIGLKQNGHADYPPFGALACVHASGLDWSSYIDSCGPGWLYDCCGHKEDTKESPFGQRWGMLLVPEEFATEAVSQFPDRCERISELKCRAFYDKCVAVAQTEEIEDQIALEKLERKLRLLRELKGTPEEPPGFDNLLSNVRHQIKNALDPDSATPGVRNNPRSTWDKLKSQYGIVVKDK